MEIIKTNIANLKEDKRTLYKLCKARGNNVKDLEANSEHPVDAYLLYTDVNSKGDEQRVLTIMSGELKMQTISKTFIESFLEVADLMGDEEYSIKIIKDITKAGREFVSCELA